MKRFYHIERDCNKTLAQQKKELMAQYKNFEYMWTDSAGMNRKIHFFADEIEEKK